MASTTEMLRTVPLPGSLRLSGSGRRAMEIDPDLLADRAVERDVFRLDGPAGRRTRRPGRELDILAVVALGGGLGSLARYGIERLLVPGGSAFPWSTFAVNIGGCLALGVVMVFVTEVWGSTRYARPFLGIGVLGGLTTFSTLMLQLRTLGASGEWLVLTAYQLGSLIGGLIAVWLGMAVTRWVAGVDRRSGRRA